MKIKELISQQQISKRVVELAEEINRDFKGDELVVICILKGSVFFCCDLMKELKMPVKLEVMRCSSYNNGTSSSGEIKISLDLVESIEGKHVLVVEDIIDSGNTLSHLVKLLGSRGPASLKLVTLLDKPDRRVAEVKVDYSGFVIPDKFVVGYGLDYAEKYRNFPYIGEILELEEDN